MTIVDRYIGSNFIAGCIPVLLLLLSLFSFLALSEELEDVGQGSYELVDALRVVAYSLPALVVNLLPVTVLLGGLLGLGTLANNQELTSMRAAAISPTRMAFPIAIVSLLLVVIVLVLQNLIIPRAEYSAAQLRGKTMIHVGRSGIEEEAGSDADEAFWTRNAGQFIRFSKVLPDRSLAEVEVYQFDEFGNLQRMLQSPKAQLLQDSSWLLRKVHDTQIRNTFPQSQFKDALIWQSLLSEKQARIMMVPASSLSSADLWRTILRLEENDMNAEPQRIVFWTQMSVPIGVVGMALMALPFLLGSVRSVSVGQRIAMGGLIGISYYLIQQISGYLAGIIHGPVLLMVMAPGLLVLLAAIILLKRAGH